jgi:hypothetical protein
MKLSDYQIKKLDCSNEQKKELKLLFSGKKIPMDFETVQKYYNDCYHKPNEFSFYMYLLACDEILENCGIEEIKEKKIHCEYCNTGFSEVNTIFFDLNKRKFFVSNWENVTQQ